MFQRITKSIKKNYGYYALYIVILLLCIAYFVITIKIVKRGLILNNTFIFVGMFLPAIVLLLSSVFFYLVISHKFLDKFSESANRISITMVIIFLLTILSANILSNFTYNPIIIAYPHTALINNIGAIGVNCTTIRGVPQPGCKHIVDVREGHFYNYFTTFSHVTNYIAIPEATSVPTPKIVINLFSLPTIIIVFILAWIINMCYIRFKRKKYISHKHNLNNS